MTQLVVDVVAAVRLARLVADDTITEPARARLMAVAVRRTPAGDAADVALRVLGCPWCLGVWVAGATVAVQAAAPRWGRGVVRVLAVAEVVGRVRAAEAARS